MSCIVVWGTKVRRKRQKKISPELQSLLDTDPICYCPNCDEIRDPLVYRYNTWFTLYFIPLFRVSKGEEVLDCPVCTDQLETGSQANICTGCGKWNSHTKGFCPSCGTPVQNFNKT